MATAFRNPQNAHEERVNRPALWVLLFGAAYFASRGMWRHAVLLALLFIPTIGMVWLYYALTARRHVERHYLERGWLPVE